MSLTRNKAEDFGFQFDRIDDSESAADPDIPHVSGDITRDGHTTSFQGRSEEHVLEQLESYLRGRGELDSDGERRPALGNFTGRESRTSDSDVHDRRNRNDDPVVDES
jgi:hypothetical protein